MIIRGNKLKDVEAGEVILPFKTNQPEGSLIRIQDVPIPVDDHHGIKHVVSDGSEKLLDLAQLILGMNWMNFSLPEDGYLGSECLELLHELLFGLSVLLHGIPLSMAPDG
jgi:hypothetical protein